MSEVATVDSSRRNNGSYRRQCARCRRSTMVVRIAASGEDWIVAEVECSECGVDSRAIVAEAGLRARRRGSALAEGRRIMKQAWNHWDDVSARTTRAVRLLIEGDDGDGGCNHSCPECCWFDDGPYVARDARGVLRTIEEVVEDEPEHVAVPAICTAIENFIDGYGAALVGSDRFEDDIDEAIEQLRAHVAWLRWKMHPVGPDELDRIDNDRGYEPGNCRWVTRSENDRNRRSTVWVTLDGQRRRFAGLVDEYGVPSDTAKWRLRKGWTVEATFRTPVRAKRSARQGSSKPLGVAP